MTNVTIERVDTIALRVPYDHWAPKPTFGGIARETMDCLLVRVTASNGLVGWGESFWGGWQAAQAAIEYWIAPLAAGQDINDRQIFARFERALHNFGRSGPFIYALAGLDIALWDLRGKLEGVPVHALLGDKKRDRVEVYASLLAYGGNIENVKRNTSRALERGYRQIKLHEKTAQAVAATRDVAGASVPIMVDTNCAWLPEAAHDAVMAMKPYDPLFVEEPIWPPEDVASLGALRKAAGMPLAAGENIASREGFEQVLSEDVLDVVQPDIAKWGGLTICGGLANDILKAGKTFCPHYLGGGIGLLASAHLLAGAGGDGWLEVDVNDNPLRDQFCGPVLDMSEGIVVLNEEPGLGIAPDVSSIERYRTL